MSAAEILTMGLEVHTDMAEDAGDTDLASLLSTLQGLAVEHGIDAIVRALADVADGAADAHEDERLKHVATRLADAAAILAADDEGDTSEDEERARSEADYRKREAAMHEATKKDSWR